MKLEIAWMKNSMLQKVRLSQDRKLMISTIAIFEVNTKKRIQVNLFARKFQWKTLRVRTNQTLPTPPVHF